MPPGVVETDGGLKKKEEEERRRRSRRRCRRLTINKQTL
jgi:hypothetical protein